MKQASKEELQKQIKEQADLSDLVTSRKNELLAERAQISAAIEQKALALGEAVLAGQGTNKEYDALLREKVRSEVCNQALLQADKKLEELAAKSSDLKLQLSAAFFDQISEEFQIQVQVAVKLLSDAEAGLDVLKRKYYEYSEIRGVLDTDTNKMPALNKSLRIYQLINGVYEGSLPASIKSKLRLVENDYPEIAALAKAKKAK